MSITQQHMSSVYVIASPVVSGLYKIGYSTQGIQGLRERYGTALGYVDVRYYHEFRMYNGEERQMHTTLAKYRVWSNREWFSCPYSIIDYELAKLDGRYYAKRGCCRKLWDTKVCIARAFTCPAKTTRVIYDD